MLKRFSPVEMLDYWKRRLGIATAGGACKVVRRNAEALDQKLADDISLWYDGVLRSADPALLPIDDLADLAEARYADDTRVTLRLPARGVRLLSVEMQGWTAPLRTFVSPNSDAAMLQRDPLLRTGRTHPVGVLSERTLDLYGVIPRHEYGAASGTPLTALRMVARPADGAYVLDESLLASSELLIN